MRRIAGVLSVAALLAVAGCSSGNGDSKPATTDGATTTTVEGTDTTAGGTDSTAPAGPSSVVIRPMYYDESTGQGGLAKFTMSLRPSPDGALRVDFSEDEVGGMGDQYRASVWNAVTVATLLTGKPLSGEYRAEISGVIDGPSAGALTTVAVLALLQGTALDETVTMTGTINPDGTVGPVGGIPEKVRGLADQGIKTVLIPVGQRNSDGVDVVQLGKDNGVDIREVATIYEVYEAFTGQQLPQAPGSTPQLDNTTYQRLNAQANSALAEFDEAMGKMNAIDPAIVTELGSLLEQAQEAATSARNLQQQGLQAGAFSDAYEAAAVAQSALALGENLQVLFTQGVDAYFSRVLAGQSHRDKTIALFDTLKTFNPKTLADASVLMSAYGTALDAYTVAQSGIDQLTSLQSAFLDGSIELTDLVGAVVVPTFYLEIASSLVDYAGAIFDVGRDLEGAPVSSSVDLEAVAEFFRKASDANFASFRTTVVKSYADQLGVSENVMMGRFADYDINIALSLSARNTVEALVDYIGEGETNSQYARLGFAITNYARNANLLNKFYSNGQLDENGQVVGVRSTAALTASLDLAKDQLGAAIGVLLNQDTAAALQVAGFESAGVEREGSTDDKFNALTTYWESFVAARVLAYLGGFESAGLS
ncbi:MAG: Lon protease [Actinomycetota bacterium]|jgi:hypothetical protein